MLGGTSSFSTANWKATDNPSNALIDGSPAKPGVDHRLPDELQRLGAEILRDRVAVEPPEWPQGKPDLLDFLGVRPIGTK